MAALTGHVLVDDVMLVVAPDSLMVEALFIDLLPAGAVFVALGAVLSTELMGLGVAVIAGEAGDRTEIGLDMALEALKLRMAVVELHRVDRQPDSRPGLRRGVTSLTVHGLGHVVGTDVTPRASVSLGRYVLLLVAIDAVAGEEIVGPYRLLSVGYRAVAVTAGADLLVFVDAPQDPLVRGPDVVFWYLRPQLVVTRQAVSVCLLVGAGIGD
jgi:hypothetical protein